MPLPGPFLLLALLCPGLLLGTALPVDPNSTTGLGSFFTTSLDNFTLFGETFIAPLQDLKREQALARIVARPQDIQAVLDSGGDIFDPFHRIFQYLADRLMPPRQPAPPR